MDKRRPAKLPSRAPASLPPRLKELPKAGMTKREGGRGWQAKRERVMVRDSATCANCKRSWNPAIDQVDHIKPLEQGGSNDMGNLQLLCHSCHAAKTAKEQRERFGKPW